MRTTIDLDQDILENAKHLAKESGRTLGEVISQLVRSSLQSRIPSQTRNGIPLFTPRQGVARPDLALVNSLRDE